MAPIPAPDSDCHSSGDDEQRVPREVLSPNPAVDWNRHSAVLSDDDESGNVLDRDYTGMFEGPEKTLEVVFRRLDGGVSHHQVISTGDLSGSTTPGPIKRVGLRRLPRADLDRICARARCTILSVISNRYLDAYVLSESSLFVYPYMLTLKTCGTTTLLRVIAVLIDLGRKVGLEIDWVGYSRKNFNFPGDQAFPHQSFHQELEYLYSHRSLCERLDGNGYTLGPLTGDHWFVFVADQTMRSSGLEVDTDRVLNIMMFDIDESVAKLFNYDQYERNIEGETKEEETERISREQTVVSGINSLCPGALIDPRAFEPCGYSMNAILFRSYSTIHITPESGSSYASFETNQKVGSYKSLISNVIRTFRPKRFVLTLMADEGAMKEVKENPLTDSSYDARINVPHQAMSINPSASFSTQSAGPVTPPANLLKKKMNAASTGSLFYKRSTTASIKVEEDCCCLMGNWVLEKSAKQARAHKTRGMSVS
uniref:adenosylmethionine decarboxylase n=1 Tax=Amphora coffeiformis TaxID=265554 RepID=A0A7S3P618_9STRA|mmetsp:Transcript_10484/g.20071  ORF Transcript_10484/g.20071 Transcript_10484/m.20071 type:complete len:482 (+) Transcript_10484:369-1814(+)